MARTWALTLASSQSSSDMQSHALSSDSSGALSAWYRCLVHLGLQPLQYAQYQLRHGGPSHDMLH
eukprot:5475734-Amphidinium_carterae.1